MDDRKRGAWLKSLKVGDRVIVENGPAGTVLGGGIVTRSLGGHIRISAPAVFSPPAGFARVGGRGLGGLSWLRLARPTPARLEELERVEMIETLEWTTWKNLSTQTLVALVQAVKNDGSRD